MSPNTLIMATVRRSRSTTVSPNTGTWSSLISFIVPLARSAAVGKPQAWTYAVGDAGSWITMNRPFAAAASACLWWTGSSGDSEK